MLSRRRSNSRQGNRPDSLVPPEGESKQMKGSEVIYDKIRLGPAEE
jgi:hypothetical protein